MKFSFPVTVNLICAALDSADERLFLARGDIAGQSPYFDGDDYDAAYADLRAVYALAHSGIRGIASEFCMSNRALARRFCIPIRTVENWSAGIHEAPPYLIGMMLEILCNG